MEMDKTAFKASEIRYLWKHRGSKNYELKCLKATGNFITSIIFEDVRNGREVSGKLVASPREGEAYHWPRLQHENLAPLFDVVSIGEKVSVHMSIVLEKSLRDIIHDDEFLRAPNCFERKKSYAEDVLWGLDYLHDKRLCLMNLNEANIFIYRQTDKAVIGDFSCLTIAARAVKCNVAVPPLYRAPELNDSSHYFDAVTAEMWACGVMMLQIFTGHAMPETCGSVELLQRVADLHYGVLVEANRGAFITSNAFISFQSFLSLFLHLEPRDRCTAKIAAVSPFLQKSWNRRDRRYGKLWQFYAPHASYSPGKEEFESQSTCDSPKRLPWSTSSEVDSYRDNLKVHFPWNKFINLNFVSTEENNDNKQSNPEIVNNKTLENQINQAYSLKAQNASTNGSILETNKTESHPLKNTENASEVTRNNYSVKPETIVYKQNNAKDFLSLHSSDITDRTNIDNSPMHENSDKDSKQIETKNEKSATNSDCFLDITPCDVQKVDTEATDKISSPLELSTGDCIRMFRNDAKRNQNDSSFINNEFSADITLASKSIDVTRLIFFGTSKNISSPSSFSTGDSMGVLQNETKWDNKEINYNLPSEVQKYDSDSDGCSQRFESESESSYPVSETIWRKEESNQNKPKASFVFDTGLSKAPRFSFYKNSIAEVRRSHSESTIASSTTRSVFAKSDPGISQCQSNLPYRIWGSHITVSSGASNASLINSKENESAKTLCAMNSIKSIHEKAGTEPLSFSEVCFSFSRTEMELKDTSTKAENSKIDNSLKDIYSPLKRGVLLSGRSLTCNAALSADNNEGQPLLVNKNKICREERKPLSFKNYKSEMCLDVRKQAVISQTENLHRDVKFYHGDTIELDSQMFTTEKNYKNANSRIGYELHSDNTGRLASEVDILKCDKKFYTRTMVERSDINDRCENDGYFLHENFPSPVGSIKKQQFQSEIGLRKIEDEEHELSHAKNQSIKDVSLNYVDAGSERSHENGSNNLGFDIDDEINELPIDTSSFTEISLNSIHEPDGKVKQNKDKKKERRRKSWFHRLCLGCKVYYDDKEELFEKT